MMAGALLLVLAQVQITAADAPSIVAAVLDATVPAHAFVDGRPIGDRPIYVDLARAVDAIQRALAESGRAETVELTRASIGRDIEVVPSSGDVRCTQGTYWPLACSLRSDSTFVGGDDGIFVTITEIAPSESKGDLQLQVIVRWRERGHDDWLITGYDQRLYLSATESPDPRGRRGWELAGKGRTLVIILH
jgi:hypothetical protein